MIPRSGGDYTYLLETMHPVFAFLFSWTSFTILKPSSQALILLTCSEYLLAPLFDDGCGAPPEEIVKTLTITLMRTNLHVHVHTVYTIRYKYYTAFLLWF